MAVNTLCEDVDGRIEDLGEAIADMVVDGGSWGAQTVVADVFSRDKVDASWAAQNHLAAMKLRHNLTHAHEDRQDGQATTADGTNSGLPGSALPGSDEAATADGDKNETNGSSVSGSAAVTAGSSSNNATAPARFEASMMLPSKLPPLSAGCGLP